MKKIGGFKGLIGIVVGIIFWIWLISAVLIGGAKNLIGSYDVATGGSVTKRLYVENKNLNTFLVELQSFVTCTEWLSPAIKAEAATVTPEEAQAWVAKYPDLARANPVQLNEMIVLLKRHPDWEPITGGYGVLVQDATWGTIDYFFMQRIKVPFVEVYYYINREVPVDGASE